jgi:glycerol uptake facilitator-like aquaporin|tara:strand:- start:2126 stop:2410 length:285 start_codon:yes stop_codon:yes gene_type:complete
MDLTKSLVEFLGTYLALFAILYTANKYPKYVSLVVGIAFATVVFLFQDISANFNPAVTLMMVSAKKQPGSDLITLVVPQLLAGYLAFLTYKFIK